LSQLALSSVPHLTPLNLAFTSYSVPLSHYIKPAVLECTTGNTCLITQIAQAPQTMIENQLTLQPTSLSNKLNIHNYLSAQLFKDIGVL
jgi:hypothetical protein